MKKITLLLFSLFLIVSCNTVKTTTQALHSGNYDQAIAVSLQKLSADKNKKRKQPYVLLLENAYKKATQRDLDQIQYLKTENNAASLEAIYNLYHTLNNRQELIKPFLPLYINEQQRNAQFNFTDYTAKLIAANNQLSDYLYQNAIQLMNTGNKLAYRKAYDDFRYLEDINPGYKNTVELIDESQQKGTDFVFVTVKNNTNKVIPKQLEVDLLNFPTYGLDDLWTVYHNNKIASKHYDFAMEVQLRAINISPEQVKERQIIREKQILDGKENLLDDNGNVVKDSLGNSIQVDRFKTITCNIYEFTQFKSVQTVGQVLYTDLHSKQLIDSFPLESIFIFEHQYATYNGNRDALETVYIDLTKLRAVPFPTNEQMIYDAAESIKSTLKQIIVNHQFR